MNQKKEKVKKVIHQFFRAMDEQDLETMSRITAHDSDMVHIGTDTREYWVGWQQLKDDTIKMFKGLKSYAADIKRLRISLSASGYVAWFSFILNTEVQTNQEKVHTKNGRYTGVMEKRSEQWQLVQTHLSLPTSEQVVKY